MLTLSTNQGITSDDLSEEEKLHCLVNGGRLASIRIHIRGG